MRTVQTARGLYVAAQARQVRDACKALRRRADALGTLSAHLASAAPNPWALALLPPRARR